MHRIIVDVKPKENLTLVATFADGEIVSYDVKDLMEKHPAFQRLHSKVLFENVKKDGIGYGITWDDELDLSSDEIYLYGKHIGKTDPVIKLLLGQNISDAREKKSLSQRQLSKLSGVMQPEICKIENGLGNPTLTTLEKLAKALDRSVASLLS